MICIFGSSDRGPGTVVMEKSPEELNVPKYTHTDIFGDEDSSDEDEDEQQ